VALAYRPDDASGGVELASTRRLLAIESVRDPDNVGGLFRTALAFGVDALVLDAATADPLYRKAVRTSMAATLRLPFLRAAEWLPTLASLRAGGVRIIALTPHPDAVPLASVTGRHGERIAIAVGSEGDGLRPETLACADLRVRIPVDPRADSLNVVSAAAIALYQLTSQFTSAGS
jgi:tRNA G18 (ribose-2'-O)-methylase SpoU